MELRDIEGFPNYKISDDGRVWSEKRQNWLKCLPHTAGYQQVSLCVDGKRHTKLVHRLVAEAFLPNPDNLQEVNHKDEDKTNNAVTNLEWTTVKYNRSYGTRNERMASKCKTTKQQLYGKPVIQLLIDGQEVARFCCIMEAERQTGFDSRNISQVCRGECKTYKGYKWAYIES